MAISPIFCLIFCQKTIWQWILYSYISIKFISEFFNLWMQRIVFHIDVNSAFLSWSAKQVLEKWYTRDIRNDVSVVWFKEVWKSIIVAASSPAKKLWIKVPMRLSEVQKIYPKVIIAPPDYAYYKKCSDEMMNILKQKFSQFQQYSIDECFVEYDSNMQDKYWDRVKVATEIKDYINKKLWFTVNVWVGNNKFLAKMASDFEKPNKVHTLFIHEIQKKLWPLPIKDLFGCGRKTEPELKKLWINTIWDLAKKDKALVKARIWRWWWILHDYANWIDDSKVENNYDDRKCIWASSITKIDTKDREYILTFLQWFASELAFSLKEKNLAWDRLTVHVRYTDFSSKSHQMKLPNPINTIEELSTYATKLFDELWNKKDINLVWMTISWLQNVRFKQGALF